MSNFEHLAKTRIQLKSNIDDLNKSLSALKSELAELDQEMIGHMAEQGQDLARSNGFTFSVSRQDLYNATDWAEFCKFAEENQCSHLFQKRLTQKAVDEAVKLYGSDVPVETYTKVSLNVRKVPSST